MRCSAAIDMSVKISKDLKKRKKGAYITWGKLGSPSTRDIAEAVKTESIDLVDVQLGDELVKMVTKLNSLSAGTPQIPPLFHHVITA